MVTRTGNRVSADVPDLESILTRLDPKPTLLTSQVGDLMSKCPGEDGHKKVQERRCYTNTAQEPKAASAPEAEGQKRSSPRDHSARITAQPTPGFLILSPKWEMVSVMVALLQQLWATAPRVCHRRRAVGIYNNLECRTLLQYPYAQV